MPRADDFMLPGGKISYGELKDKYGEEFATKAFDAVERLQAGEGDYSELMSLYFDYCAQEEGVDHIVLGPDGPEVHHADPEKAEQLEVKPLAKGGDGVTGKEGDRG